MIIVMQKEYKNLPLLMFYIFALIAVTLRPIYIVLYWTGMPFVSNLDYI